MTAQASQLCNLANAHEAFERDRAALASVHTSIAAIVTSDVLSGPASDEFRREWRERFAPFMGDLSASLDDTRNEVFGRIGVLIEGGP